MSRCLCSELYDPKIIAAQFWPKSPSMPNVHILGVLLICFLAYTDVSHAVDKNVMDKRKCAFLHAMQEGNVLHGQHCVQHRQCVISNVKHYVCPAHMPFSGAIVVKLELRSACDVTFNTHGHFPHTFRTLSMAREYWSCLCNSPCTLSCSL